MKNLKFIFFVGVVSLGLVGCAQTQTTPVVPTEITPVVQTTTPSLIENFADYSLVTDKEEKADIVSVCDDFTKAYADKLVKGDVKKLSLYEPKPRDGSWAGSLEVYLVPSYGLTEKDFEKVNACGELGSKIALKLVSGNILWGYAYCGAGAMPNKDEPAYADFQECTVVEKQLADYLKQ